MGGEALLRVFFKCLIVSLHKRHVHPETSTKSMYGVSWAKIIKISPFWRVRWESDKDTSRLGIKLITSLTEVLFSPASNNLHQPTNMQSLVSA